MWANTNHFFWVLCHLTPFIIALPLPFLDLFLAFISCETSLKFSILLLVLSLSLWSILYLGQTPLCQSQTNLDIRYKLPLTLTLTLPVLSSLGALFFYPSISPTLAPPEGLFTFFLTNLPSLYSKYSLIYVASIILYCFLSHSLHKIP